MSSVVRGDDKGPGVGIVNAPTAAEATAELHRVARVSGAENVVSVAADYRRAAIAGGTASTQWRIEVQAWGTAMGHPKISPAEREAGEADAEKAREAEDAKKAQAEQAERARPENDQGGKETAEVKAKAAAPAPAPAPAPIAPPEPTPAPVKASDVGPAPVTRSAPPPPAAH
ncbi:hypothetical protein [Sphingomonas sp. TDK1]|uniref:hypothetical protein n=1 Tax=Sphingomonas sp. TDK1 TaxID=453247 RepID=UPI000A052D4A|nr:hypothetical protein [Sphingomonas sp. TDK1]